MALKSREEGENEMLLGVGRYRLEGTNFMRDDKGWGAGNLTCTAILLGLLGLRWSDLTEKVWNQTLIYLRLPGLKIGDEQHTPLLLFVLEVI